MIISGLYRSITDAKLYTIVLYIPHLSFHDKSSYDTTGETDMSGAIVKIYVH